LDVLVAAKLPDGDGINDEVRRATASKRVVVVAWITCRCDAQARPKLTEAAGFGRAIPAAWSQSCSGYREREERRRWGIYRGGRLGRGVRVRAASIASDGSRLRRVRPGLVEDDV
jgi:hypothetical protein